MWLSFCLSLPLCLDVSLSLPLFIVNVVVVVFRVIAVAVVVFRIMFSSLSLFSVDVGPTFRDATSTPRGSREPTAEANASEHAQDPDASEVIACKRLFLVILAISRTSPTQDLSFMGSVAFAKMFSRVATSTLWQKSSSEQSEGS